MIKKQNKTPQQLEIKENFLNMINGIYENHTANIILSGGTENLPLKISNKTRMFILPLLFNTVILAIAIIQEKEKVPNWEGRVKLQ